MNPEAHDVAANAYDEPVSVRAPTDPEILARVDACLAALTPEQLAELEEAERLDRLAWERNRR